jgi:hypothetical protein
MWQLLDSRTFALAALYILIRIGLRNVSCRVQDRGWVEYFYFRLRDLREYDTQHTRVHSGFAVLPETP